MLIKIIDTLENRTLATHREFPSPLYINKNDIITIEENSYIVNVINLNLTLRQQDIYVTKLLVPIEDYALYNKFK